ATDLTQKRLNQLPVARRAQNIHWRFLIGGKPENEMAALARQNMRDRGRISDKRLLSWDFRENALPNVFGVVAAIGRFSDTWRCIGRRPCHAEAWRRRVGRSSLGRRRVGASRTGICPSSFSAYSFFFLGMFSVAALIA